MGVKLLQVPFYSTAGMSHPSCPPESLRYMLFPKASIKKQFATFVCEGRGAEPACHTGWTGFGSGELPCPGTSAREPYGGHGALLLFMLPFWQILCCLLAECARHRNNSSAWCWYLVAGGNSCSTGCLMAWECCSQRCLPDPRCWCPRPNRKSFLPRGQMEEGRMVL